MNRATATNDHADRARQVLPGGASGSWRSSDFQLIERTSGAYVWTDTGQQYIDHILAWGTIVIGHCDPRVNDAVTTAVRQCDLTTIGPQRGEVEAAEKICAAMPSAQSVAFCVSGTEATLHAVQLARAVSGRTRLLKFHGSYHGWHDMLAVGVRAAPGREAQTGLTDTESAGVLPAAAAEVVVVPWNDHDQLRDAFAAHGSHLAAAFCEPYVQSYGCVAAAPGFLELLRDLCSAHGVLLVFDEVKTAFRHAVGGYQSICQVIPDLTTFSKALGNGYSVGGLAGSLELMAGFEAGRENGAVMDGTSNASPYVMAAANATLDILNAGGIARLAQLGERMRDGLRKVIADSGVTASVTGVGGSWAVYMCERPPANYADALRQDSKRMIAYNHEMRARGVMEPLVALGDRRLCLATTEQDVDETVDAAAGALRAVS